MKRISIAILLLAAVTFGGCQAATWTETWRGPAVSNACDPQPGLGYQVGQYEFIPVGNWTWVAVDGRRHTEMIYVRRDGKGGAK